MRNYTTMKAFLALAGTCALLFAATAAQAQDTTWQNTGTSDWFTPANWNAGVPTSASNALIINGGTAQIGNSGAVALYVLVGNGGNGNLSIGSGGTLTADAGVVIGNTAVGTVTVNGAGAVLNSTGDIFVGENGSGVGTLTIGNGAVVTLGAGAAVDVSTNAGSSGTVNLNAGGTLIVGGADGIRARGGTAAFNFAGGTIKASGSDLTTSVDMALSGNTSTIDTTGANATFSGALFGTGPSAMLTKTGTGTLTLNWINTYAGGTNIEGGTVVVNNNNALGSGKANFSDGTTLQLGTTITLANDLQISGSVAVDASAFSGSLNGVISGSGSLVLIGGANELRLEGNNTYSGSTIVENGTLMVIGSISASSGVDLVNSGATLDISGFGNQTIRDLSGVAGSEVVLGSNALTVDTADSSTFSGSITSPYGGSLVKDGAGTLILAGANTFNGGTTVHAGTLEVENSAALGTGAATFANGSSLKFGTSVTLTNALTFGDGSTIDATAGNGILSGPIVEAVANSLDILATGHTVTITNANPGFQGDIDLHSGTLAVGVTNALGTAVVTFANGTALKFAGGGSVALGNNIILNGSVTVDATTGPGALSGTVSGIGTLIVNAGANSLTLSGNNTYLGGTTLNTGTLIVGSDHALGAEALTINGGALQAQGDARTIDNDIIVNSDFSIAADSDPFSDFTLTGSVNLTGATRTITVGAGVLTGVEFNGVISNGGVSLTSSGSLSLVTFGGTQANTYTGDTTVGAGVDLRLNKTADTTAIAGNMILLNNSTVTVVTDQQIASTSNVTLNGNAVLSIGETNSTNQTINALTGSGTVNLVDASNLTVASGDFSGNIIEVGLTPSALGSLTKTGPGTLTLSGSNSYKGQLTIEGGIVNVGSAANIGAGGVSLQGGELLNTGTLTWNKPVNLFGSGVGGTLASAAGTTAKFSKAISGLAGNVLTIGDSTNTGTVVLSGTNTYSGGTVLSAGTLVAGSASALGVGNVTINNGTLESNGTAPVKIVGNYQQNGGDLLIHVTSATASDQFVVQGSAQLGGNLVIDFSAFTNATKNLSYTILTAQDGISGTFTDADDLQTIALSPTLKAVATIDSASTPEAVIVDTALIQLPFATLPGANLTPNQFAVASNIDTVSTTSTNPGFQQLVGGLNSVSGNAPSFGSYLNQLLPLAFANFASSTAFNNASFTTQAFDNYLANHRGADGSFVSSQDGIDYSGLAVNDPNIDTGLQSVRSRLLAWSPAPSTGLLSDSSSLVAGGVDMKDVAAQSGPTNLWNVFVTGNVVLAQDFSNNQTSTSYASTTTGAVQIGADYKITPHFLAGVTFGYGHTNATLDTIGSNANVNTYSPGAYASYSNNGWYANALGSYGFSNYSQSRAVSIGAFSGSTHSSPGGDQIVGNLDGGYDFHKGNWTFGPTIGLQYVHLDVDGYSETGLPGANLSVNENQSDSLRSVLGGRVSYAVKSGDMIFTPHLSASWQHEFMDQSRGITSQFSDVGAGSFVVNTANPSRESALVDVGFDGQITNTLTVFTDYAVQAGQSNYFGQSIQAGVKIGF